MRRIRIGFHGVPGAGKTVLQAMFYGFRNVDDGCILFTDAPTIQYLRPRWEQISQQQTPAASAMGKPDRLLFNIKTDVAEWEIEALDFAGALVEPVGNDGITTQLAHEVRAFLAGCDGLFVLVDPSDPDPRQLDAVAVLLKTLHDHSPTENGGIKRPVGLLLTKFDKLGPIDADSMANQQRALECLHGHPILKQIRDVLARHQKGAWWFRIFPVSAFGTPCKEGEVSPPSELKPYNLHEPLRWLVAEVDAELTRSHTVRRKRRRRNSLISVVATTVVLFATMLFVHRRMAFWEARRLEWDSRAWAQATAADVPTVTDYEGARNLYRGWLQVPGTDPVRKDRATAAIGRLEGAWDRLQYAKIYEAANGASTWQQFDAALVHAKAYDDADRGIKRMSEPVKGLLQWANKIRSGAVAWHVSIFGARDDLSKFFAPGISFELDLNGRTGGNRWIFVANAASARNYDLGVFPIAWGQPLRVQAKLTVFNKGGDTGTGDFDFTQPIGPPESRIRGVKMSGTGDAILEWECKGLAPPALTPYSE